MNKYIYYHSVDFDGLCGKHILQQAYDIPDENCIGYSYNPEVIDENLITGDNEIYLVDCSFPKEIMQKMHDANENVYFIDHHATAIKDSEDGYSDMKGLRDDRFSGCELALLFVNDETIGEFQETLDVIASYDESVYLLGRYDVFFEEGSDEWNDLILPFQYGLRTECFSQDVEFIDLDEIDIAETIEKGLVALDYEHSKNKALADDNMFFEREVAGKKAICLMNGHRGSMLFEYVYDEAIHDMMLNIRFDGEKYNCSLYSTKDDVNCGLIAKEHMNGGGHFSASGGVVDSLEELWVKN